MWLNFSDWGVYGNTAFPSSSVEGRWVEAAFKDSANWGRSLCYASKLGPYETDGRIIVHRRPIAKCILFLDYPWE